MVEATTTTTTTTKAMRKFTCIMLLAVICYEIFRQSSACRCVSSTLKDRYCDADFAICAKIKAQTAVKQEFEHKYEIEEVMDLKNHSSVKFECQFIYGFSELFDCATLLDVGKTYLITGHMQTPGKPFFYACNWVEDWNMLSSDEKDQCMKYNELCVKEDPNDIA